MLHGNDPPARIAFLEISDENMIPTNSGLKWDLLLQNSGPFLCEGSSSNLPNPPGYGPVLSNVLLTLG